MEKIERSLSDVQSDLSQEPAETAEQPKKVKKVAKKTAKKVTKKVDKKASKPEKSEEGKVSLSELAGEAKITTASARRKLRDADMSPEGRWKWDPGSKALKDARKVLGLDG